MTPEEKVLLIEANLELVIDIAERYDGRGVAFIDLVQEGNLGLIRAAEQWSGKAEFAPFASFHIRQAMNRLLA